MKFAEKPMIYIVSPQRKISISLPSVKQVVLFLCSHFKIRAGELSVYFVGKKKMSLLHEQFFQDPSPTDCISFPYENSKKIFLGEIFICPEVAEEYILKKNEDLYKEITLYVIHGFLHLFGYNDLLPQEKKKMRRQEKKMLYLLQKNNLRIVPRQK